MNFRRSDLIPVVIVVALLAILGTVLFSKISRNKAKAARISCVGNQKQIVLGHRIFAHDHNERYPMKLPESKGGAQEGAERGDLVRIFQVMSNELSIPKTLLCPADDRKPATNWTRLTPENISYFVGLDAGDTHPEMLLTGDRNLTTNGMLLTGIAALGTSTSIGYSRDLHDRAGNIGLADGSVQQFTAALLHQQLLKSGDATNRVLFPQ